MSLPAAPPVPPPPLLLLMVMMMMMMAAALAQAPLPATGEGLRPESDLSSNCFNFPEDMFTRDSCIIAINNGNTPYLPMTAGDYAIDFTLHDLDGERWNLGETLRATAKPVVMVWGMLTCPGFQGLGTEPPWDRCSYWDEHALVGFFVCFFGFVRLFVCFCGWFWLCFLLCFALLWCLFLCFVFSI